VRTRGFFRCGRPYVLMKKKKKKKKNIHIRFFEIYGVSARTGGLIQCGHFSDKGVLQMRTSALFCAKNLSKFMVCPHEQGGKRVVEPIQRGEGGQFFSILCGRPLWTALNAFVYSRDGNRITSKHSRRRAKTVGRERRICPNVQSLNIQGFH